MTVILSVGAIKYKNGRTVASVSSSFVALAMPEYSLSPLEPREELPRLLGEVSLVVGEPGRSSLLLLLPLFPPFALPLVEEEDEEALLELPTCSLLRRDKRS